MKLFPNLIFSESCKSSDLDSCKVSTHFESLQWSQPHRSVSAFRFFRCMPEQFHKIIYNSLFLTAFHLPFPFHSRQKLQLESFVVGNKKIINNVIPALTLTDLCTGFYWVQVSVRPSVGRPARLYILTTQALW